MERNDVVIDLKNEQSIYRRLGISVPTALPSTDIAQISANSFTALQKRPKRNTAMQVFSASLADIEKPLKTKTYTDPSKALPDHYKKFFELFSRDKAE